MKINCPNCGKLTDIEGTITTTDTLFCSECGKGYWLEAHSAPPEQPGAVVFLDVYGVIMVHRVGLGFHQTVSSVCVLNKIVESTGASVVLTVQMPHIERTLKSMLYKWGFKGSVRGSISFGDKGAQIQEYLDSHPDIDRYIVIDDEEVEGHDQIRTDPNVGLSYDHLQQALDKLGELKL